MATRYWPLEAGRIITSPFGPREGGFHAGVDFGFPGGSGGRTVTAIQSGTVIFCGAADGYGGPDPAGWIVIDSDDDEGAGVWEYGHVIRRPEIVVGARIRAGQPIGQINASSRTNGGVAPHLHLSRMPRAYDPAAKIDPLPILAGSALEPPKTTASPTTAASTPKENTQVGWTGDPVWLADVLRAQDPKLNVREMPGWKNSGHGDMQDIWGVMVHHTGNAAADAASIRNGRPDLDGPLAHLHIAQDGTVTVVAVGVCWHAGMGNYPGLPTNNANYKTIGIECAWPRDTSIGPATQGREPWPDAQIIAMRDTVAAILSKLGVGSDRVIGHKEWAGRVQGKWDPGNLDMNWFRGEVAKALRGDFKAKTTAPT